jgi:hypothetical protein
MNKIMGKVVKLTQSDLIRIVKKVISEQSVIGAPNRGVVNNSNPINNHNLVTDFLKSREIIERRAKELYNPSNLNVKGDYQKMKEKEDAFCHQSASAYATELFGEDISYIIGQMNELKGAFRVFFKGTNTTPRFQKFDSGYEMDTNNNNLGIELSKKFPGKTLQQYMELVKQNIEKGLYYNKSNFLVGKRNL